MNKLWSYGATKSGPGYTSGQLMTLGGVDKDGNDATNPVTYMMLQSAGRLVLHDPPQALRIHKNTPPELWGWRRIETTKIAGGVPTFENDDVIYPVTDSQRTPAARKRPQLYAHRLCRTVRPAVTNGPPAAAPVRKAI